MRRPSAAGAGLLLVAAMAATVSSTGEAASASAAATHPLAQTARTAVSTTVGQTSGAGPQDCGPTGVAAVALAEDGAPTYAVPGPGVLTRLSYRAGTVAGTGFQALVLTSTGAFSRTVVGRSPVLPAVANTLNSYQVRIPVQAGASLGIRTTSGSMACAVSGSAGDVLGSVVGDDTSTQLAGLAPSPGFRPDISAVWETDDDGDGYGDVTQDACPRSALAHDPCPAPETVLARTPKKRSTQHRVTVTFVASLPGSTFTCSLDGKAAKPCTSPYKTKVGLGQHTIAVTAVSPAGIPDATPASVRFKVTAKRAR